MMKRGRITVKTIEDARDAVRSVGAYDWDWGIRSSAEGFAKYVYDNYTEIDQSMYNNALYNYLVYADEMAEVYASAGWGYGWQQVIDKRGE